MNLAKRYQKKQDITDICQSEMGYKAQQISSRPHLLQAGSGSIITKRLNKNGTYGRVSMKKKPPLTTRTQRLVSHLPNKKNKQTTQTF